MLATRPLSPASALMRELELHDVATHSDAAADLPLLEDLLGLPLDTRLERPLDLSADWSPLAMMPQTEHMPQDAHFSSDEDARKENPGVTRGAKQSAPMHACRVVLLSGVDVRPSMDTRICGRTRKRRRLAYLAVVVQCPRCGDYCVDADSTMRAATLPCCRLT